MVLRNLLKIINVQFKLVIIRNLFIAILFLIFIALAFGINNLDEFGTAYIAERFISLIGVVLITSILYPENNKEVIEVIESRVVPYNLVILLRLIISIVISSLAIYTFLIIMRYKGCEFDFIKLFVGTFSTTLFLGSMGLLAYILSKNIIVGYLVSLSYYLLNFSLGVKLGKVYLFSLSINDFRAKSFLLWISFIFLIMVFVLRILIRKLK